MQSTVLLNLNRKNKSCILRPTLHTPTISTAPPQCGKSADSGNYIYPPIYNNGYHFYCDTHLQSIVQHFSQQLRI